MSSGIKVGDEVKCAYQNICLTTAKAQKLQYGIFKFSDDNKKIVVESVGTAEECKNDWDGIVQSLPDDDVRYVCIDFSYKTKEGHPKSDVFTISWHPERSSIKKKMICASSFNYLKSSLGISRNILEGDSLSEVDSRAALEKVGGRPLSS